VKITEDMIPDVSKQPGAMAAATAAGKQLGDRLPNGHNRMTVTGKMQEKLMAMFAGSV